MHVVALRTVVAIVIAVALGVVTGCGSSDSKPGYCSDRSDLQSSVKGLTSAASSLDVNAVKAQVTKIQQDATSLASSAKSDFPDQTSALKSSVDQLQRSVAAVTSTPSASQVASIAAGATSVVSSVKGFVDASQSKCS
jgi:hypothetical protein